MVRILIITNNISEWINKINPSQQSPLSNGSFYAENGIVRYWIISNPLLSAKASRVDKVIIDKEIDKDIYYELVKPMANMPSVTMTSKAKFL